MSNLTDLVPPLEMCKLIPQEEFAGAYAMWVNAWAKKDLEINGEKVVMFRTVIPKQRVIVLPEPPTDKQREFLKTRFSDAILCKEFYPAPTLQEIMAELPASNIYRIKQTWTANFINDSVDNGIKSKNPATAALKLWLKLKGIEA